MLRNLLKQTLLKHDFSEKDDGKDITDSQSAPFSIRVSGNRTIHTNFSVFVWGAKFIEDWMMIQEKHK